MPCISICRVYAYFRPARATSDPFNGIADSDIAASDDFGESAATPVGIHQIAKSRLHLVHAFTGFRLACNPENDRSDAQQTSTGIGQRDAADHQVGAPSGWRCITASLCDQCFPYFALHQRDLTHVTLVGGAG